MVTDTLCGFSSFTGLRTVFKLIKSKIGSVCFSKHQVIYMYSQWVIVEHFLWSGGMVLDKFFEVDFWEMIMRTTCAFIVLLILARVMGKKQISQLTFFHYVTGITIGSIAADIAGESRTPFLNGIISMVWWALLTMLMSYIAFKSKKARILLDDQPSVVIYEGKIVEQSLKKMRLH